MSGDADLSSPILHSGKQIYSGINFVLDLRVKSKVYNRSVRDGILNVG